MYSFLNRERERKREKKRKKARVKGRKITRIKDIEFQLTDPRSVGSIFLDIFTINVLLAFYLNSNTIREREREIGTENFVRQKVFIIIIIMIKNKGRLTESLVRRRE